MNVTCPHCRTAFRVDPDRVPAGGVRARCSICRGVISVSLPDSGAGAPAAAAAPARVEEHSVAVPVPAAAAEPATAAALAAHAVEPPPPAPAPAVPEHEAPIPPPAAPVPAPPLSTSRPPPAFGSNDPQARARRLARALVSDMLMYHPERRDRGLREGTLRQEFREEIKKSWEEYVGQVGAQLAQSSPHFRDALNDILANGQKVF